MNLYIGKSALVCSGLAVFVSVYFSYVINVVSGYNGFSLVIMSILVCYSGVLIYLNDGFYAKNCVICLPVLILLLMSVSSINGVGGFFNNLFKLYFYVPILLGFIFSRIGSTYIQLLKLFIAINFFLMVYEFSTSSYILPATVDMPYFYGRAKGLLSYSKEIASILIIFSLFFIDRLRVVWLIILPMAAFLSGSRLAVIVVCGSVLLELYSRYRTSNLPGVFFRFILFLVFLAIFSSALLVFSNFEYAYVFIARLENSINFSHSSNVERILFWKSYIATYMDYEFTSLMLGSPGYAQIKVGNGAESSYLNLLTDGGIISLLFYLVCLLVLFLSRYNNTNFVIRLLVFICAMQITRVGLGFIDGSMLWFLFWSYVLTGEVVRSDEGKHA